MSVFQNIPFSKLIKELLTGDVCCFLNQENNSHLTPILQRTLGSQPLAPVAWSTPMTVNSEAWIPGPARDPDPPGLSPYSGSML